MKNLPTLIAVATVALLTSTAIWAQGPPIPKADTISTINLSPNPIPDGDILTITGMVDCLAAQPGTLCENGDEPISEGKIQIQVALDGVGGNPTSCENQFDDEWDLVDDGDAMNGEFITTAFNTTGFGGQTIGFRSHYVPSQARYHQSSSPCEDLDVTELDPFPDGSFTLTQGFYGAAPAGVAWVRGIIDYQDETEPCEEINSILEAIGEGDTPYDCDPFEGDDRQALADFLSGGGVGGNDGGFLPTGFQNHNLAAQKITLLLNLYLDRMLTGDDIPIQSGYYINIDPVADVPSGIIYDPVATNSPTLGTCTISGTECTDAPVFSPLGLLVLALDNAGTTVEDILIAADDLLEGGSDPQDVHGVELSAGDLTKIIGLINESYDNGVITGFVTAFDAD